MKRSEEAPARIHPTEGGRIMRVPITPPKTAKNRAVARRESAHRTVTQSNAKPYRSLAPESSNSARGQQTLGLRWQSAAATPLSERGPASESGVALRFPPHSIPCGCGSIRAVFIRVHLWFSPAWVQLSAAGGTKTVQGSGKKQHFRLALNEPAVLLLGQASLIMRNLGTKGRENIGWGIYEPDG